MLSGPPIAGCDPPKEFSIGPEFPEAKSWNEPGEELIVEWAKSKQCEIPSFSSEFPHADRKADRERFERAFESDANRGANQGSLFVRSRESSDTNSARKSDQRVRVAILSFLFNWPSTGGGIIHTVELATFLRRAGFEVELFYARYAPWGIGQVESCPFPGRGLDFREDEWDLPTIQTRFREAVDGYSPDYVLITDSWNIKPYLAEAVRDYPYFLRLQALECLCPLNNLRQYAEGSFLRQCPKNQLADPEACSTCLDLRGQTSGSLHQMERNLCEVQSPRYRDLLFRAFQGAEAVLTLNRQVADLVAPHTSKARVVTWGMDPARFSHEGFNCERPEESSEKTVILFAGLVRESIKGFSVLKDACRQLWQKRQDFELVVTGNVDSNAEFLRSIGWKSQTELPEVYRNSDLVVVPSIAQEGLSRTAVEAMASGRPVIGSRIGGLAELIEDGVTGLFATPGDSEDLAKKIDQLLDDAELRHELGRQGRQRFERDFSWPVVIERDYRPLLAPRREEAPKRKLNTTEHPDKPRRLEIGPGQNPLPGFESLDMVGHPTHRARWGYDWLTEMVGPCSCDEVYASHVLEHVPWNRTLAALKDVLQILKPGGFFEVWVPNFEYIVDCYRKRICGDAWRRDNPLSDPMLWVNGRIFTYGPENENFHFACFDYEHLSICLSQAGFVEIERLEKRTRGAGHGPIDLGIRCRRPLVP